MKDQNLNAVISVLSQIGMVFHVVVSFDLDNQRSHGIYPRRWLEKCRFDNLDIVSEKLRRNKMPYY